ncbi:hypothetical protein A2130_01350 [Candidatus Woesebacteria bacterium GWC2_33_12]|uniref:2'-deoxynucleoside 5'-phosphate N-hydrolase 1 n=1 Tax=Candidatus Woesebacteria bacterium GW2011_GWB1_33_22 TaxID=1618566 RepID=A0A0F9ZJE5_9BACT|nr:MAG: hypothetical protein UR29_C0012G0015 [Candidatus Woesebacteria bacterium GW2011_GWC2_33_12]KKP41770.1 MAG: hypothetical protein UR33_C0010G0015 [Candidatus Woesebacteria bacterium GW2011_GWA2_33_20]KKP44224.1 MAG: hypothetical protein UR35_C0010G0016 [Candidatus Woesebacteria bacterium GW2011_GWB1_33_22]KKP45930.1 MAG: hypothetical protein UR37_C0013G0016 [Microgenomates group bacterium GW2011_GWC1_33_28]KKP49815.1 MAG: hypothetical protein UR41_C0012G0016 [Candidatus Woesebacteria bact
MKSKKFTVFIAGVMQGSKTEGIHSQDYRTEITNILNKHLKNVEVVDPDKTDPDRLNYNFEQSKKMFFDYCAVAGKVDLLISFLPIASMGSSIEMWNAYQANIPIFTITPMPQNWVIKLLSKEVFSDLEDFDKRVLKILNNYFK